MVVAAINSIVTGAGIVLLVVQVFPLGAAIGGGLLAAALHLGLFYRYQRHRFRIRPALPEIAS